MKVSFKPPTVRLPHPHHYKICFLRHLRLQHFLAISNSLTTSWSWKYFPCRFIGLTKWPASRAHEMRMPPPPLLPTGDGTPRTRVAPQVPTINDPFHFLSPVATNLTSTFQQTEIPRPPAIAGLSNSACNYKQPMQIPMEIPSHMPIKTAEEVMAKYHKFMNKDCIGRVAIKLVRNTYFGEKVRAASTVNGNEHTRPLDTGQLSAMKAAIRTRSSTLSPTEFELIWVRCI